MRAGDANFFIDQARHRGIKITSQRKAICSVFFSADTHQSAEQILKRARDLDRRVSLATVYRTLKLLQQHGLARAHNFGDDQALFEPCFKDIDHHDHLICTDCGFIVEFVDEKIELLQEHIAKAHDFTLTHHRMELYGLCKPCTNKASQPQ